MRTQWALIFIVSIGLMSSCNGSSNDSGGTGGGVGSGVVPKGTRILAMDTNYAAQDFSFLQSYAAAQSIGVSAGTTHIDWATDEAAGSGATSGTFTDSGSALADSNAFYSTTTPVSQLSLTVAPIDTAAFELPSDLAGLPMNNANVIARFNKFMDWVLAQLPAVSLTSIQIGNEIDTLPSANTAAFWTQYQSFLSAVVTHLHSVKPGVKIGVTVTLYGLTGSGSNGATALSGIVALAGIADEIGLTYYPMTSAFQMKNPSVVASDFAQVFLLLPNTPIYVQEAGYSTSSTCGGSVANQVSFVDQIFSVWDAHASQIPFISFLRMNDYSVADATSYATSKGLGSNNAFIAYLQTLGFRTYTAPSGFKSAWSELQSQAQFRGW